MECPPSASPHLVAEGERVQGCSGWYFGMGGCARQRLGLGPEAMRAVSDEVTMQPALLPALPNFEELVAKYGEDNARYLLYKCSGGYPIGFFSMYVRSSIPEMSETEHSQLIFIVGFNFYGKARSARGRLMGKPWEWVHDRVTANVLNRIKRLCEWQFARIQQGD